MRKYFILSGLLNYILYSVILFILFTLIHEIFTFVSFGKTLEFTFPSVLIENINSDKNLGLLILPLIISVLIISYFFFMYLIFFHIGIIFKISGLIVDRFFLKHLLISHLIYFLIELSHNESLKNENMRIFLAKRIDKMIIIIRLKSIYMRRIYRYNYDWISFNYNRLENYLLERKRWLFSPIETTKYDLENDFIYLLESFVDFNKIELPWSNKDLEKSFLLLEARGKKHVQNNYWNIVIKNILFLIPLVIFIMLLINEEYINFIELDKKILFWLSVAWFLMFIDNIFNLGILKNFLILIKDLKDLYK